jgi:molybdopterin synthase sulfur carrier subunit
MKIKLYANLRPLVGNQTSVEVDAGPGDTIRQMVDDLLGKYPALRDELLVDGEISPRIHIFLNGREVRYMDGLDMVIPEGADLRIFPPVGGGA